MNTKRLFHVAALAIIAGSLAAIPPAQAAGDETTQLQNEVNALKQKLDRLDARLRAMESQKSAQHNAPAATKPPPQPAAPAAAQSGAPAAETAAETAETARQIDRDPTAALNRAWKSLSRGMSQEEVHRLLGEPTRRLPFPPNTVWYYTYRGKGSGSVVISSDGRVVDWQHPPHIGGWF